ncbi:TlpA family protein disulfide reductase [Hellea sp.]|nr:TlpA family protein disulfide reductase [Hellea sp.]
MSVPSFFSVANAIRLMLVVGLVAVFLVVVQSCSQPKTGLELFAKDSLKKLTALESPPVQPAMVFKDPDGTEMRLPNYKGKVILVNVWATWCAPCIAEMPMLDELQAKKGNERFEVVTISLDRTPEEAQAWFVKNGITNLPLWHDSSYGVSGKLNLPGLPTSVFYNKQGREIARIPGEVDWTSDEALALVDYLTE